MWIVTTKEERSSLIPEKKFKQLCSVIGEDNLKLIIADSVKDLDIVQKNDVVLVETKNYDLVDRLRSISINTTAEDVQAIKFDEDKILLKRLLNIAKIPTPKLYDVADVEDGERYFVKPLILEDSIGIDENSLCSSRKEVLEKIDEIYTKYGRQSIIEEYIDGYDATVGILRNENGEYDVEAITIDGGSEFLTYDAKIKDKEKYAILTGECKTIALKVFRMIGAKNYARIDMRIDKETNTPYVLEVNLYPGLGEHGYMFRCFEYNNGENYKQFINKIIENNAKTSKS